MHCCIKYHVLSNLKICNCFLHDNFYLINLFVSLQVTYALQHVTITIKIHRIIDPFTSRTFVKNQKTQQQQQQHLVTVARNLQAKTKTHCLVQNVETHALMLRHSSVRLDL